MSQLTIFDEIQSATLRDKGMESAVNHANNVHPNWGDRAYNYLMYFIRNNDRFMTEDVRRAAAEINFPDPPSQRAWGAVIIKAVKAGKIRRAGYAAVKNPKAHGTPASVWQTTNT